MKNALEQEERKTVRLYEFSLTGLFILLVFIFFAFFYNHHLYFEEQTQLFLLSRDFFLNKLSLPGGLAGWIGGFLTQFYLVPFAGPFIIVLLLYLMQRMTRIILVKINSNPAFFILSFIPALNGALVLCDEFYPLSGIIGLNLALMAGALYVSISNKNRRFFSGLLLIPLNYWLAGGSFLMLLTIMILFEILAGALKSKNNKSALPGSGRLQIWQIAIFILIGGGFPLLVRQFIILQPLGLTFFSEFYYDLRTSLPVAIPIMLALPAILMLLIYMLPKWKKHYHFVVGLQAVIIGFAMFFALRLWANFSAEEVMTYDYYVRNGRWEDAVKHSEKKPPRNNLSLAMLNLSLVKTNMLGDRMFMYEQNGADGLFLPFAKEYVAPMMGNEIFFNLGLVNASQEYSFESMETTPDLDKSVRMLKRLAETNLINGNYEVSRKYIHILKKTMFYRKWAFDTERYLYREDLINNHPVWGEKRKMMITKDFFFGIENMESNLNLLLRENPGNKTAFEYLMGFYLLNKDLKNFMDHLPMMEKLGYSRIPVSYQEAIMYVIGLSSKNPLANLPYGISNETKIRMQSYAQIYTTRKNAMDLLKKDYSGTYWYYLHFKQIKIQVGSNKSGKPVKS
jgi:hypothetical protein